MRLIPSRDFDKFTASLSKALASFAPASPTAKEPFRSKRALLKSNFFAMLSALPLRSQREHCSRAIFRDVFGIQCPLPDLVNYQLSIFNSQLSTATTHRAEVKSNRAEVYAEPVEAKSLKVQSKSLETKTKSLEKESSRLLDFFSTELDYFSTE